MMLKKTIITEIEHYAPLCLMEDWDHSGIQVESIHNDIKNIAVCLDPSPTLISKAAEAGADMVLTHHPLTLEAQWVNKNSSYTDILRIIYRNDIFLYASHTSLDANPLGPVSWFADELHLKERSILDRNGSCFLDNEKNTAVDCGIGCVGNLPTPLTLKDICQCLKNNMTGLYYCPVFRFIGEDNAVYSRIAICPGSGGSLSEKAREAGADLYITGDYKYHVALEEHYRLNVSSSILSSMHILDVGHFSLEEEMMRRFAKILQKKLPKVNIFFLQGRDPFRSVTVF